MKPGQRERKHKKRQADQNAAHGENPAFQDKKTREIQHGKFEGGKKQDLITLTDAGTQADLDQTKQKIAVQKNPGRADENTQRPGDASEKSENGGSRQ